jgi:transposase
VLTPAQAKRLAAKYKKGASLREVASEFGVSYGTAHTTVKTAGVLRSKGGAA